MIQLIPFDYIIQSLYACVRLVGKSSQVVMEAWDGNTYMTTVRVLYSMVVSYVIHIFHHTLISFGVYYLFFIMHILDNNW